MQIKADLPLQHFVSKSPERCRSSLLSTFALWRGVQWGLPRKGTEPSPPQAPCSRQLAHPPGMGPSISLSALPHAPLTQLQPAGPRTGAMEVTMQPHPKPAAPMHWGKGAHPLRFGFDPNQILVLRLCGESKREQAGLGVLSRAPSPCRAPGSCHR